ncbi:DNA sulfur modification protein DndB [Nocardia tengchongensis]|uniref:DNA sulfur modification protein DndB n=1 Tax=Nocardia tengchongensis TaxID=2055889 RepID=UPI0036A84E79
MDDSTDQSPLAPYVDVTALQKEIEPAIKIQKYGILTRAGAMKKIVFTATIKEVGEKFNFDRLLNRRDFDIESTQAGNRDVSEPHWKKIQDFLLESDRPFLGMLTVAMPPDQVEFDVISNLGQGADLVKMTIYEDAENPVTEDGQHRIHAMLGAWSQVRDLKDDAEDHLLETKKRLAESSVTIEMLLEDDPDILSTTFVRMASTKAISASLIAVMDKTTIQNRLGSYVMSHSQLFKNRTTYLSQTAAKNLAAKKGQQFEALYQAAAVRNAAANLAGVGVRDRTPDQRENILKELVIGRQRRDGISEQAAVESIGDEVVAIIDYAYQTLPGWKELSQGHLNVSEFKDQYVHGAASGLYTIVTALTAARSQDIPPNSVVDAMSEQITWRKYALKKAKDLDNNPVMIHEFFENTLVLTTLGKDGEWKVGTAGAQRSTYEKAIDTVLRHMASADKKLAKLALHDTYVKLGLQSANPTRRGRGSKKPAK